MVSALLRKSLAIVKVCGWEMVTSTADALVFGPEVGGLLTVTVVPPLPSTKPYVPATDCASVLALPVERAIAALKAAESAALCMERFFTYQSPTSVASPAKPSIPMKDRAISVDVTPRQSATKRFGRAAT
jgi:hypothetical protein